VTAVLAQANNCPIPPGIPPPALGQSDTSIPWLYYQGPSNLDQSDDTWINPDTVIPLTQVNQPFNADWRQPGFNPAGHGGTDGLAPSFSGWATDPSFNGQWKSNGIMPFGENCFCADLNPYLADQNAVDGRAANTTWTRSTDLYIITSFTSYAQGNAFGGTLTVVVDNDLVGVWVNGIAVNPDPVTWSRDGCTGVTTPLTVTFTDTPAGDAIQIGTNTLAIQVRDHGDFGTGNQSFFMASLTQGITYATGGQTVTSTPDNCVCITSPN